MGALSEGSAWWRREVRFGDVSYDFYVGRGDHAWPELRRRLGALDADRFVLVVDEGLPAATVAQARAVFAALAPTAVLRAAADEKTKTLATLDDLAERAIAAGATRRSCVVAMGGGLVGNVAGLLASLLYRGVRLVHLPTTLLAMSDSVLSLKQAVNSRRGKNHLGAFHPPALVWNQLDFLESLPTEEIRSALCETVKNVLSICPERYDEVAARLRPDGRYPAEVIAGFIDLCVDAKSRVMRDDPWEKHEALVLEYGHTIGHAAELLSGGSLRHGYAVGIGMLAAARISAALGYLDSADEAAHRRLLERNGTPSTLPAGLDIDAVLGAAGLDNKRGYVRAVPGMREMILLDALGQPHREDGSLISRVPTPVVRAGIASVAPAETALVVA